MFFFDNCQEESERFMYNTLIPKIKEIKNAIESALSNPPPIKQMLGELRLNNVLIKQREGDINIFSSINNNLIEKVWKSMKVNQIIAKESAELEKLGLHKGAILRQRLLLLEKIENSEPPHKHPLEGFVSEGFLELEVFKDIKKIVN